MIPFINGDGHHIKRRSVTVTLKSFPVSSFPIKEREGIAADKR